MKFIGISGKARSGKDELCSLLCLSYGFERVSFADKIKEIAIEYFDMEPEVAFGKKTKNSRQILQGIGLAVRKNISKVEKIRECFQTMATIPENGWHNDPEGISKYPLWIEHIATEDFGIEMTDLKSKKKYVRTVLLGIRDMFYNMLDEFTEVTKGEDDDIWINYSLKKCKPGQVYIISDIRYTNEKRMLDITDLNRAIKIVRVDKPPIEAGAGHPSETELDLETQWDYIILNEHKNDWKDRLLQSSSNMIRKFTSENFFTDKDIKEFKTNI